MAAHMTMQDKLQHAVRMLGMRNGLRLPAANGAAEAAGIEYAAAVAIYKAAEQRKEAARQALLAAVEEPTNMGTHVLVQSPHVTVTAQMVRGAKRIDHSLLVQAIMQTCKVDLITAQAAVDHAKVDSAPQMRLVATLAE